MKLNFLPQLQMAYEDAYGNCIDTIDEHVCADNCGDFAPEHARIRRGGWLHKNAYADVMVDPTDATLWNAAEADGNFMALPELRGTYDGGTPKLGTGYGDNKEKYLGSDFKSTITDQVYKENWADYRSLVGSTSWHFVFITETQVHVSGVPVTVAPKNPITENVDDEVTWQSDISWFEFFPPKPYDAPMDVFACAG